MRSRALLAGEGAQVALVARRKDRSTTPCGASPRKPAAACWRSLPTSARRRIASASSTRGRRLGGLDILVNNDGAPPLGTLLDFDDAAWDKAVQQNLMSVVRLSRRAGAADARARRRPHRQHHRALGAAAAREFRFVDRDLGRRAGLRQDLVARGRRGFHHRQLAMPRPHRDRPPGQGFRLGRRARRRGAGGDGPGNSDAPARTVDEIAGCRLPRLAPSPPTSPARSSRSTAAGSPACCS